MNNYQTLRAAMNNTPFKNWVYRGYIERESYGDSHCVCGHEIKFEHIFRYKDTMTEIIIGSTCAKKFPDFPLAFAVEKLSKASTDRPTTPSITETLTS